MGTTTEPPATTMPTPAPKTCIMNWVNDKICDDINNHKDCFYDGGDCCFNKGSSQWKTYCTDYQCDLDVFNDCGAAHSKHWFGDGWCDDENNNPECFYDGGDCCFEKRSNWEAYCNDCECKHAGESPAYNLLRAIM